MPDSIEIASLDHKTAESVAEAIRKNGGMEHPERKGLFSSDVAVRYKGSGFYLVEVRFADPEPPNPSIRELIPKWHANPSIENRLSLWDALHDMTGRCFSHNGTVYRATLSNSGQLRIIEVY